MANFVREIFVRRRHPRKRKVKKSYGHNTSNLYKLKC